MKSNIETLEEILSLASNNFRILKPDTRKNGAYTVGIRVANYSDSLFIAADIMKMCMLTLESEHPVHSSSIIKYNINVSNMLEIALQFLPFEEAEVLDELQLILKERKEVEE